MNKPATPLDTKDFPSLTCGLIDAEVRRRADSFIRLTDELCRAIGWMERCAEREKSLHMSRGYAVRIEAARALLSELGE